MRFLPVNRPCFPWCTKDGRDRVSSISTYCCRLCIPSNTTAGVEARVTWCDPSGGAPDESGKSPAGEELSL
ncbi:hypothetical protein GUITHDRAFT_155641, partial [Guillardia theta CCMP2712]